MGNQNENFTYTIQELKDKIALGRDLIYEFYNFHDDLEKEIDHTVRELLKKYNRPDLQEVIYSTVKELAINGVKANLKSLIFQEQNIDRTDNESIEKGLKLLHEILSEPKVMLEYDEKARQKHYKAILRLKHSAKRILVMVSNSIAMSDEEEERIREKFQRALKYDSIAEYYMDNLDDAQAEGAGLGITMIVLLLKSVGINPHAFAIYKNRDKETVAKIEIPISEDYVSSREIYEKLTKKN